MLDWIHIYLQFLKDQKYYPSSNEGITYFSHLSAGVSFSSV